MQTQLIERNDWKQFMRTFNHLHDAALVSVEILRNDVGAQTAASHKTFHGLDLDSDDSATVEIILGERTTHMEMFVHDVTRLWVERTDEGTDETVAFESADGSKTLLKINSPVINEMLDTAVE